MKIVRNPPIPLFLSVCAAALLAAGCGGSKLNTVNGIPTFKVGGTVKGLNGSPVVLNLNGSENLTVSNNGSFTFSTAVFSGATFHVTIASNPTGELCTIGDPSDTAITIDVTGMTVNCAASTATVSTIAGHPGIAGTADGAGSAAYFNSPIAVAADAAGNLYVSDSVNRVVRKIDTAGNVTTLAGTAGVSGSVDGTGGAAQFGRLGGITVDASGNVYVVDTDFQTVRKITPAGVTSTVAGKSGTIGSTDGAGTAATFNNPAGIAVDAAGNLYVADRSNSTIRKIDPSGTVTTLAGSVNSFGSADGTGSAASFYGPVGVAVDATGNVYVADGENTIRKVTPAGVVTTLAGTYYNYGAADGTGTAASFNSLGQITVGPDGNLYVVDQLNNTIRKVTPAGVVTTIAGTIGNSGTADGNGGAATFNTPAGIAVDHAGNIYVADFGNNTIRKVTQ